MGWMLDPFPAWALVSGGLLLCLAFGILSRTTAKGSRLALLLALSFGVISAWSLISTFSVPETWSYQTLIARLVELPIVATFATLCAVQASRMPATNKLLKRTLQMGVPLIFGAWLLAFAGEQMWPQPILEPFARMPVRNFALLAILCIPIMAYQWILVYTFVRASRSEVATMRLKLQNLLVAAGIAGYALSGINVVAGYAFQAFVENPLLREITLVQFAIEDRLLVVWAPAFLVALVLAGGAAASGKLQNSGFASRLKARERFEARWWQMEAAGAAGYLAPQLYALSVAAGVLGLSDGDLEKATQSVKLAALLKSEPNEVSPNEARELLESLNGGQPDSVAEWGDAGSTHFAEVVEAALSLSTENDPRPDILFRGDWRWLALAAAGHAGLTDTHKAVAEPEGRERVFIAYAAAMEPLAKQRA